MKKIYFLLQALCLLIFPFIGRERNENGGITAENSFFPHQLVKYWERSIKAFNQLCSHQVVKPKTASLKLCFKRIKGIVSPSKTSWRKFYFS